MLAEKARLAEAGSVGRVCHTSPPDLSASVRFIAYTSRPLSSRVWGTRFFMTRKGLEKGGRLEKGAIKQTLSTSIGTPTVTVGITLTSF